MHEGDCSCAYRVGSATANGGAVCSAIDFFSGINRNSEAVFCGRQGTNRKWRERARRIDGAIKVETNAVVGGGVGIEEPASAVRAVSAGCVSKNEVQRIVCSALSAQGMLFPCDFKLSTVAGPFGIDLPARIKGKAFDTMKVGACQSLCVTYSQCQAFLAFNQEKADSAITNHRRSAVRVAIGVQRLYCSVCRMPYRRGASDFELPAQGRLR